MSGKFGAFVVGGVVGAAVAFLCSPRNGEQNRAMVADRVNEAWGSAQQVGSQFQQQGQQAYDSMSAGAQRAAGNAQAAAQDVFNKVSDRVRNASGNAKPVFTDRNDELREKIDAARQRIAAQVQKNAEEAGEKAGTTIPVDAAEDGAHAASGSDDTPGL